MRGLAIVSGGLDSTVLAHQLVAQGHTLEIVTFLYNQRHRKEIEFAQRCAQRLGQPWRLVDLSALGAHLRSALTTASMAVPDGSYTAPVMVQTVVPNRNTIFLTVAYGIAASWQAEFVALAVHAGDHTIYPDCRPEFLQAVAAMQQLALGEFCQPFPALWAPFQHQTKGEIVALGATLGVPWTDTWSCYKGQAVHCGTCGTCVERREAFQQAGIFDPTRYAIEEGG